MSADRAQALRSQSPLASLRSASSGSAWQDRYELAALLLVEVEASTNVLTKVVELTRRPLDSDGVDHPRWSRAPRRPGAKCAERSPTVANLLGSLEQIVTPFRPPSMPCSRFAPDSARCRHGQRCKPRSTTDQQ